MALPSTRTLSAAACHLSNCRILRLVTLAVAVGCGSYDFKANPVVRGRSRRQLRWLYPYWKLSRQPLRFALPPVPAFPPVVH